MMHSAAPIVFRRLLPAKIVLAAIVLTAPGFAAQPPKVQAIDYQNGALCIQSSVEMDAPQVEAWPGGDGNNPTELVILSFPQAGANIPALQQSGDQLILRNPELRRFLVSPLNTDKKGNTGGFQLVLELVVPPNTEVQAPPVSLIQPNRWMVPLKPNAQYPIASAADLPQHIAEAAPSSTQKDQNPSPISNRRAAAESMGGLDPKLLSTIQDLQAQIVRLTDELKASTGKQQTLQEQLSQYNELIRPYQAEFGDGKEEIATIQNLRLALVKMAQKLKETEAALAEQIEKNKALTHQLAELKPESRVETKKTTEASGPTALMLLAEDKPPIPARNANSSIIVPKGVVISASTPVSSAKKPIIKPAPPAAMPKPGVATPTISFMEQAKRLEDSLRDNPRRWQAYVDLSKLYADNGNPRNAESVLTRLLKANPGYAPGYYQLARIYVQEKRPMEAQVALTTYQRLQPQDVHGIRALQASLKTPTTEATALTGKH